MRCLSPESIQRPNGKGGRDRITVPCGKCYACIMARREKWAFRLEQELKCTKSAHFITLTYNDENLTQTEFGYTLNKYDLTCFLKRLRANLNRNEVMTRLGYSGTDLKLKSFRYFIVGEYGEHTKRPHYHGLFFGLPVNPMDIVVYSWSIDKKPIGMVNIGTVTAKSIRYCTRYMLQEHDETDMIEKEFCVMSRNPGIGSKYFDIAGLSHSKRSIHHGITAGHKVGLPRYYRDKLFNQTKRDKANKEFQKKNDYAENLKREALSRIEPNMGVYEIQEKEQYKERIKKIIYKKQKL